jgi:hypothetical protein
VVVKKKIIKKIEKPNKKRTIIRLEDIVFEKDEEEEETVNGIKLSTAIKRLQEMKAISAYQKNVPHACRKETCNPQNEPQLTNRPLTNCVYLCNFGQIHVCLPDVCTEAVYANHGELVCPISGLVVGVEESLFTRAEPHYRIVKTTTAGGCGDTKRHAKKPFSVSFKKMREYADLTIEKLFYGAARIEINAVAARKRKEKCEQKLKTYICNQKRNKEFVMFPDLVIMKANIMTEPLPYELFSDHDSLWIANCSSVVMNIWENLIGAFYGSTSNNYIKDVLDAPTKPNMESITLAVLYMMRNGYSDIIPYDEFVSRHIPNEKDLVLFGYNAKKVKPGKDLIQRLYEKSKSLCLNIVFTKTLPQLEEESETLFIFKPTSSGHYCQTCKHRFEVEEIYTRHKKTCF